MDEMKRIAPGFRGKPQNFKVSEDGKRALVKMGLNLKELILTPLSDRAEKTSSRVGPKSNKIEPPKDLPSEERTKIYLDKVTISRESITRERESAKRAVFYGASPHIINYMKDGQVSQEYETHLRCWVSEIAATWMALPACCRNGCDSCVKFKDLVLIHEEKLKLAFTQDDLDKRVPWAWIVRWQDLIESDDFEDSHISLVQVTERLQKFIDEESRKTVSKVETTPEQSVEKLYTSIKTALNEFEKENPDLEKKQKDKIKIKARKSTLSNPREKVAPDTKSKLSDYIEVEPLRLVINDSTSYTTIRLPTVPISTKIRKPAYIQQIKDWSLRHAFENTWSKYCEMWISTYIKASSQYKIWRIWFKELGKFVVLEDVSLNSWLQSSTQSNSSGTSRMSLKDDKG